MIFSTLYTVIKYFAKEKSEGRKNGIIFLATFLTAFFLHLNLTARDASLEVKASYLHPTKSRFRDIYHDAGIYNLETNIQIHGHFYSWISAGFLYTTGHCANEFSPVNFPVNYFRTCCSIIRNFRTKCYGIPIELGLKYYAKINNLWPYFGMGIIGSFYGRVKNDCSYTARKVRWNGIGPVAKLGFLSYWNHEETVFTDVFLNYTHLLMHFKRSKRPACHFNLKGLSFGIGLGHRF